jgi:DNA repair ATPase RecN
MGKRTGIKISRDRNYSILKYWQREKEIESMHIPVDKERLEYIDNQIGKYEKRIKKYHLKSVNITQSDEEFLKKIKNKLQKKQQLSNKEAQILTQLKVNKI